MRKWNTICLALALLLIPAAGGAQEMPQLFSAVYTSTVDGLKEGMAQAVAGMEQDLTLDLSLQSGRIKEGKTVTLTITAGNPRPADTPVTIELKLPQRLSAAPDVRWQAVLPAAEADEETGALVPSVSTFTREITLIPGGGSEQAEIQCEMSMGTRFYRGLAQMELCVSDVTAAASVREDEDGRLYPGDAFAYEIEIVNAGTAAKDVNVELRLPQGVAMEGELPSGFTAAEGMIAGRVRAEAAVHTEAGVSPSSCVISLPAAVDADILKDDEDAARLLNGTLLVDGKRVPLPRLQVCGAKISAQLVTDTNTLEAGEQTQFRVVVVNSGLAPADVRLSCVLPEGLRLAQNEENGKDKKEENESENSGDDENEKQAKRAAVLPPDDGAGAAPEAVLTSVTAMSAAKTDDRTLIYDLHMPAGEQTAEGVEAAAQVIRLNVQAESTQENLNDRLVGTALAWRVDEGETQLGEAVAMRLRKPGFWGISKSDWNALFWAAVLLVITVGCLTAAAKTDKKEEDFCCD